MTKTEKMSKARKFFKANKALTAFFTVVLIIGLFPIGMAAFGGSDGVESAAPTEAESAASSTTAPEVEGDVVPEVDVPEVSDPTVESDGTDSLDGDLSADPAEVTSPEAEKLEEAIDELAPDTAIDPEMGAIEIVRGDPDIMTLAAEDNKQTIVIDEDEYVLDPSPLRFDDGKAHKLTIGEGVTLVGDIVVENKGNTSTSLTIDGEGTIKGTGTTSVVNVFGSNLVLEGNVRIYNGCGSELVFDTNRDYQWKLNYGDVGGGVLVQRAKTNGNKGSSFKMNGGIIGATSPGAGANSAIAGGGIFIDSKCTFEMNGGTVGYNNATRHEGGGIFLFGNATISAGSIIGNRTATTFDWGGGGIFVNNDVTLTFKSTSTGSGTGTATIRDNTANGLGGGVSGCPHAYISIGDDTQDSNTGFGPISNGFAIYNNTANKSQSGYPTNPRLRTNDNFIGDHWAWVEDAQQFGADDAMDFYCINGSFVYGQRYNHLDNEGDAWKGRYVIPASDTQIKEANDFTIKKGDWVKRIGGTVGLTSVGGVPETDRDVLIAGNYSNTHGGGIGCNGSVIMGSLPTSSVWDASWSFDFNKQLLDGADNSVALASGQFSFELCTPSGEVIAKASNDVNGNVNFVVNDKDRFGGPEVISAGNFKPAVTYDFVIKEVVPADDPLIEYDAKEHPVKVTVNKRSTVLSDSNVDLPGFSWQRQTESYVEKVEFEKGATSLSVINRLHVEDGTWTPTANKLYYGDAAPANGFTFILQAIQAPDGEDAGSASIGSFVRSEQSGAVEVISEAVQTIEAQAAGEQIDANSLVDDGRTALKVTGTAASFANFASSIVFPEITYKGSGDYWYLMTEEAAEGYTCDPSAYLIKVHVDLGSTVEGGPIDTLKATQVSLYYAESIESKIADLTPLMIDGAWQVPDGSNAVEFVNFDQMEGEFGLYSFAVNAITEQPVASDQRCLVDPKIYKVLEGRQLKDGQFNFSLVQVGSNGDGSVNWADTSGAVISTAANDQYGMVDFDAANNQAGEGEEPCCLVFTAPGTYHYRVVEVAGSQTDPSIDYSKEIITFTAVIEGGNGQPLTCTDMYYGKVQDGQNVRFDESADPTWHPTMTNKVRPMELKVCKTSELDRNEGLEGATYGLYLVSTEQQNDVKLGEATSDADGWMTFTGDDETGLDLKMGNLYYFKEIAAPSQHTVSQFRSLYFYITPDPTSEVGYALKYTDTKASVGLAALASTEGSVDAQATGTAGVLSDDKMLFTYDYDNGVFDEATAVTFNKLDGRTHEWVQGATLAVIDKDSGQELESWVTGDVAHQMVKKLDVDKVYILRELSAPTDYNTAKDIEFKLDAYGNLEILSGMDNKNAEQNKNTLTMFDFMVDAEMTLYEYNEREEVKYVDPDQPNTTGGDLVQTGDKPFPIELVIAAVAALGVAGFAVICVRRQRG